MVLAGGYGHDDLFVTALAVLVLPGAAPGRTLSGWADYIHLID